MRTTCKNLIVSFGVLAEPPTGGGALPAVPVPGTRIRVCSSRICIARRSGVLSGVPAAESLRRVLPPIPPVAREASVRIDVAKAASRRCEGAACEARKGTQTRTPARSNQAAAAFQDGEEFEDAKNMLSSVGVVHIDGNGVGAIMRDLGSAHSEAQEAGVCVSADEVHTEPNDALQAFMAWW